MIEKQSNGSLCFCKKGHPLFIFRRENYKKHCNKRDKLKLKIFLKEIDKTLFYWDVITGGPQENKRTYYKVFKSINTKYNIQVRVLKIPVFRHRQKRRVYFIATTFDFWGFD